MNAEPYYQDDLVTLYHGDCRDVLATLPGASVDAVVTDPPYELGFMGKAWDASGIAYSVPMWSEVFRVLKPGGHLLSFGGTRTWHRMVCAIEDAGFEIRDELAWLYGSGFPKSLDVSKAIDKARYDGDDKIKVTTWFADVADARGVTRADVDAHMGTSDMGGWWLSRLRHRCAVPTIEQIPRLLEVLGVAPDEVPDEIGRLIFELNGRKGQPGEAWFRREVVGERPGLVGSGFGDVGHGLSSAPDAVKITAPATPEAERWSGWGTAIKPAHEPVICARKPFADKDLCPAHEPICLARKPLAGTVAANVLEHGTGALNIDGCRIDMGAEYDPAKVQRQSATTAGMSGLGESGFAADHQQATYNASGRWPANVVLDEEAAALLDRQSGTTAGVDGRTTYGADRAGDWTTGGHADSGGASRFFYVAKAAKHERPRVDGKAHATVKPVELMRWLVRLVTPPGGTVLDPFAGSGTTAEACVIEGFHCQTIEADSDHLPLIVQRLSKPIEPTLFGAIS